MGVRGSSREVGIYGARERKRGVGREGETETEKTGGRAKESERGRAKEQEREEGRKNKRETERKGERERERADGGLVASVGRGGNNTLDPLSIMSSSLQHRTLHGNYGPNITPQHAAH